MDIEKIKELFAGEEVYPKSAGENVLLSTSKGVLEIRSWPVPQAFFHGQQDKGILMDLTFTDVIDWVNTREKTDWERVYYSLMSDSGVIEMSDCKRTLPHLKITFDRNMLAVCDALTNFIHCVPMDVRKAVNKLAEKRWLVLCLAGRIPEFKDLLLSSPALALSLASEVNEIQKIKAISRLKQRNILELLGFPKLPSVIRILRKIHSDTLGLKAVSNLRQALNSQNVRKTLGHIKTINSSVIEAAVNSSINGKVIELTPSLFIDLSALEGTDDAATQKVLRDVFRYTKNYSGTATTSQIQSLKKLWRYHEEMEICESKNADKDSPLQEPLLSGNGNNLPINNYSGPITSCPVAITNKLWRSHEWMEIYELDNEDEDANLPFPEPPLPGNDNIIPIKSYEELANEAIVQDNCLSSYNYEVAAGDVYFYRVIKPERATLSLFREGTSWRLDELKSCSNEKVNNKSWLMVKRWLKDCCLREATRDRAQQILSNGSQLSFQLFSVNK